MITIQTAFSIADGFKNEVCELLNLDSSKVQLTLISQHASMKNVVFWEHIGVQLIEDKVIGVSADFLRKCISEVSFTPLRFNIYTNVCIIWKEKQDDYVNFLREATIYASALMLIKGLSIPYIPMFAKNQEEYFKPILLFLKQQFQLEGKMFRLPGKEEYYKIRLTGISALTEKMKYNTPLLIRQFLF